jgi:DNA-directed RNA polymerase subunit RPC12/RpoP
MIEIKCNQCEQDIVTTTELIMSEDVIECKYCNNVVLICDDELKMQINEVFNV